MGGEVEEKGREERKLASRERRRGRGLLQRMRGQGVSLWPATRSKTLWGAAVEGDAAAGLGPGAVDLFDSGGTGRA